MKELLIVIIMAVMTYYAYDAQKDIKDMKYKQEEILLILHDNEYGEESIRPGE